MRAFLSFILLIFATLATAQSTRLLVNDNVDRLIWEEKFDINDQSFHSTFRGYESSAFANDSLDFEGLTKKRTGVISPILAIGAEVGFNQNDEELSSSALLGFTAYKRFSEKLSISAALYGGMVDGAPLLVPLQSSRDVYPGVGEILDRNGRTATLWDGLFAINFSPSEIFSVEVGRSKHFWGDGYRSLFLSDNAAAYPYLKLKTKVWHLEYANLFSWQQGILDINDGGVDFENKFTSTHMLSWNISAQANIQIFETIIWQGQDSLSQRGFDINYLNPIIFYRPVEFAAGSADNAIIGLGFNYKFYPSYQFYLQVAFDEFLLDQFQAREGWWGNKFGVQIGAKGFDVLGIDGLFVQAELNLVRPFTYSHGSPVQNYAHFDQPLAHPLGANFYEANIIGNYEWREWEFRNHLSYVLKGDDEVDRNQGGDIFRSYVNPSSNKGNYIGQGIRTEAVQNSIYASRVLDRESDSRIMLGYHARFDMGDTDGLDHVISLTLRSNFGDAYR